MNLFDNILNQSKNKFLGTQPSVPSTPSFATPQAPRTVNYTAPQVQQKPSMTLFSDEQQMFQKMKADNLDDNTAYSMLKKRRMDILGGNDLGNDEKEMLLKMQADNVPVKQAVSMIQQRRKDQFNKKYEEGNLLQKGAYNTLAFAAGNLETLAKYSGNTLDFITGGTMGFGDEVNKMEQVTSSPEFSESSAFTAGTYLPDVALAVSPVGGQYLAGAKGMTGLQGANLFSKIGAKNLTQGLMGRSAVVGAGFGATQPILDKGSDATMEDIATGAAVGGALGAVATPVIGKVLKYGQAGYRGGLTGMGKSITRDIKSGVNAITPSGANISTKANRFNANEIREFTKTTGQSPGDFATSRGMTKVGDDAVVEATNLWQKSKDQADEALKAIKGRFRFTDEGEDLLKTTIDDLETRLVNTKSPDSKRISQLKAKYEDSGLTMSEINEVKRAYSNNYKYSFVDAGSESAIRSRNLQDAVRKWQFKVAEENGLTNLKEINKTTQGWKMFADSLSKKIQGSSGNNNVSLTDWIALSGGSPENIALYLGKKLASSDKVKSGAIKLFSKKIKPSIIQASKADIQQANFLKNVNRGVSGVGDNSGGKSLVRPVGLIEAPKGQATGAKNFRVNQPKEAPAQKSDITSRSKIVRPGTKPLIKPKNESKVIKPVGSTVIKPTEKKVETNITRNETIEKGFSDSAKSRWDKGDFTMKERGEATKYIKSNYKGKEYTIDGKKYKVDAIDNRNEQVRLVDSEGNIIRVKTNKLPETKVTDKDIFDYYNGRVQKGYKTILSQQKIVKPSPQVKPVEKTMNAISNEELNTLTKKATELGKYDGSYDVTKGKKLYRGGNEDGIFWTDDIDIAKSFGDEGVAEKIITMKKPLDVRSKDIREYIKKNTDINIDDATSAYSRSLPEFKKLMKWAKENGYDGIIGKTSDNGLNFTGNEFVTLSPPKPLSPQKTVKASDKYDIFDEDTKNSIFVYKPKGYSIPKNSVIYPSESGIGVSYKGKGRVDFYISTKDGRIKVSTDNLGANQIDFIQDAWKKVGKDMEQIYEKSLSPQKTVKPNSTTNAKQQVIKPTSSDTIPEGYFKNAFGEIQKNPSNKKGGFIKIPEIGKKSSDSGLIEEARKYKSAEEFIEKGFKYKPPKKVYRGIASEEDLSKRAGGTAFASLGKGLYTTKDKSFAKKFGKIEELDSTIAFPRNPLVIERPFGPAVGALKDWMLNKTGLKTIAEFHKKYGEDYSTYLQSLGYDGAVIGDEIVKYGGKKTDLQIKDELRNIWANSKK